MLRKNGQAISPLAILLFIGCIILLFAVFHASEKYAFGFLLVLVIFLISFTKINIALIILILSMLLSPEFETGGIGGRSVVIRLEDILLFVVFLGWMARMAVNKEMGLLKKTPLNLPIGLYAFFCVIATGLYAIENGNFGFFRSSFFYLLKYFEYYLLFFMVVNNLHDLKQAKIFVFFILLTCFFVSLYGASRIPSGERISAPFEGREGEPNTFAAYLLLMMGLILGLLLYNKSIRQRVLLFGLLAVTAVVFILTLSRGGWLGAFPMFLTFVFLNKKHRFLLLTLFIVLLISMPYWIPQKVLNRFQDTFAQEKTYTAFGKKYSFAESAAHRIDSWRIGVNLWLQRPFFGWGVPSGNVIDNQYTRVLTETGFFGFMAYLWLLISIFRVCWRAFIFSEDSFAKGLSIGVLAGFAGLLTNALASATFILIRVMEPFWFLVAIVAVLSDIVVPEQA
jgi:O-antigen ligase